MRLMEIKRSQFITSCFSAFALYSRPFSVFSSATRWQRWYVNAIKNSHGQFGLQVFEETGKPLYHFPLPGRGHSFAFHRGLRQLVVFSRRPGVFALVIDFKKPSFQKQLKSPEGRHFYGHGVFSKDRRWLFATENDYLKGQGLVAVYDAKDHYKRVEEFPSHGIGPHELQLLSSGKTLVVANGGIQTHPDYGRQKLNLTSMDSSLTYLDPGSGKLLDAFRLPSKLQKMSIRHLSVTLSDEVAVAMQYQGPAVHHFPLVGIHQGESSIQLMPAPSPVDRQMRNYCGSVAVDLSGNYMAVSCPRGNMVTFWSVSNRQYLGSIPINDGCGVAPGGMPGEFLISSGTGALFHSRMSNRATIQLTHLQTAQGMWDNHMFLLNVCQ